MHGDGARAGGTGVGREGAMGKASAGSSGRMGVYKTAGAEAGGRWDAAMG